MIRKATALAPVRDKWNNLRTGQPSTASNYPIKRARFLNPMQMILVALTCYCLIGPPIAYFFDPNGYYFVLLRNLTDSRYILIAYVCSIYAIMVLFVAYKFLNMKRRLEAYCFKPTAPLNRIGYLRLWQTTFILSIAMICITIIQTGLAHPLIYVSGNNVDAIEMATLRLDIRHSMSLVIYNLNMNILIPFNIFISILFLRKLRFVCLSLACFLFAGTFSLVKAQLFYSLTIVLFCSALYKTISFKRLILFVPIIFGSVLIMYLLTRYSDTSLNSIYKIITRVIYGQISGLPYYLMFYEYSKLDPTNLLPSYIASILGIQISPAAHAVTQLSNPGAYAREMVGAESTLFIGEAYAVFGYAGVLFSPFLIVSYFHLTVKLFTRLPKNIFTVFLFSYCFFLLLRNSVGGFGYFIFSSLTLMLFSISFYFFIIRRIVK